MKGKLIFALLLAALPAFAQTPTISQSASAAWGGTKTGSVSVAATAGHTLWVGCNVPSGFTITGATDSQSDTFVLQQTQVAKTVSQAQYVFLASNIKGGTTKVTCTANAAPGSGEIYVLDVAGADQNNPVCASASFDGTMGKATGSLTLPVANCLVLAYAVSGTVSNASGWTALSTLDSNLAASIAGGKAGTIISASFGVSQDWSMVLFALQPVVPPAKPFVYQLQGGPSASFPMTIPPACGPADGPNCTITIQLTDTNNNVVPTPLYGTVSLVKTGAQGTQVIPVVVIGPASQ